MIPVMADKRKIALTFLDQDLQVNLFHVINVARKALPVPGRSKRFWIAGPDGESKRLAVNDAKLGASSGNGQSSWRWLTLPAELSSQGIRKIRKLQDL